MRRKILLSEICNVLNLHFVGEDVEIDGLNLCNRISEYKKIISYATDVSYMNTVCKNEAIAVLVVDKTKIEEFENLKERKLSFIICEQPEKTFYDIHDYLFDATDFYDKFEFEAIIGSKSDIHPSAVVESGAKIGNNVTIGANSVIRKGTIISDFCSIGCNSIIGSEGFQILRVNGINRKIRHCGGVVIGEKSAIGDNTTICNALFEGYTYIGKNVMIDNLTYVGHNGHVGNNTVLTAGIMLCGSSIIEDNAWIGVNSSVLNRVTVGNGAKIGMGSVVTRDIEKDSLAYGVPAKVKQC